ncbi:MAG: DtxR family transcriptional regulator [Thermotogae bacterium]|nr:DtxR family transcriptional regulator [Thermotogota bacterium]
MVVTESLENYLRVIYEVQLEREIARIKDIIKRLSVKTSSAVEAVRRLSEKGLVVHEKYGYIKLTQRGILEAQRIYQKHKMLYRFFKDVLGMGEEEAEELACGVEHHVTEIFYEKLDLLLKYFQQNREILDDLKRFLREGMGMNITLGDIKPGETVKVVKVMGNPQIKERLMSMGIIPGIELKVERIAPLGDPLEIKVRDFRLSLRKEEAESVIVEKG